MEHILAQVAHARLERRDVAQLKCGAGMGTSETEIRRVADLLEIHAEVLMRVGNGGQSSAVRRLFVVGEDGAAG
jgi:hypothetical protein